MPSERQSIKFLDECLIRKSVSLYDNIKLNKLPLFRQRIECKPTRAEWTVRLLKADCQPFSKFYIAFQSRAGNLLCPQKHAFPVSVLEYGKLCNCVKSDLIDCRQNLQEPSLDPPDVQAIVVDAAALVYSNYP